MAFICVDVMSSVFRLVLLLLSLSSAERICPNSLHFFPTQQIMVVLAKLLYSADPQILTDAWYVGIVEFLDNRFV